VVSSLQKENSIFTKARSAFWWSRYCIYKYFGR
jgi:hypothetical protein